MNVGFEYMWNQVTCIAHDETMWIKHVNLLKWFLLDCLLIYLLFGFHYHFQYVPFVWIWPYVDHVSFLLLRVVFYPIQQMQSVCMCISAQAMERQIVRLVRQLYNSYYTLATANALRIHICGIQILKIIMHKGCSEFKNLRQL